MAFLCVTSPLQNTLVGNRSAPRVGNSMYRNPVLRRNRKRLLGGSQYIHVGCVKLARDLGDESGKVTCPVQEGPCMSGYRVYTIINYWISPKPNFYISQNSPKPTCLEITKESQNMEAEVERINLLIRKDSSQDPREIWVSNNQQALGTWTGV